MRRKSMLGWAVLVLAPLLAAASCDLGALTGGGVPASQSWIISDESGNISVQPQTYMSVLKGGAMSQGPSPWHDGTTNCTFNIPLSGNWNGTVVIVTSTGGGCGIGYILTLTGTANGEYGTADRIDGTYRISYTGGWPSSSGNWAAFLSH